MSGGHTPGPWAIHERLYNIPLGGRLGEDELEVRVIKHGRDEVCYVPSDDMANARLIAAAPAMREALLYIEEQLASFKLGKLKELGLDVALEQAQDALASCTTPSTHNEPAKEGRDHG